jgi:DNA/RNA endonuclease YhcR with UshA esterase domain
MKYTLEDDSGTITLLLWQDLYDRMADAPLLTAGGHIGVSGEIREFAGELEIVPQLPDALEILGTEEAALLPTEAAVVTPESSEVLVVPTVVTSTQTVPPSSSSTAPPISSSTPTPAPEVRAIGDISGSDVGHWYTVALAAITDLDHFSKGVKYTLTDGTGDIVLLLWQNVLEEIPDRYAIIPSTQVQVTGVIDEFAGDLEIIPREGSGVKVLAQAERLPLEARQVKDISPSDEGRVFTVEGSVTRTEGDQWLRVWLNDGTGEMLIFVPERTVPYLPSEPEAGQQLRVTGEVDIHQGVLELIPLAGADVVVP